jgi:hypothetical protein
MSVNGLASVQSTSIHRANGLWSAAIYRRFCRLSSVVARTTALWSAACAARFFAFVLNPKG